jgi:hypothetical protein
MYVRVTTFQADPARVGELAGKFKEMTPTAKALPGIVAVYAAWRADGKGTVTSVYNSKADADAAAAKLQAIWAPAMALLKGAPSMEGYDDAEKIVG